MIDHFEVGEFYMYQYERDVCIEVMNIEPSSQSIVKATVRYWNLGYSGKPWLISLQSEEIRIHASQLDFWHHLDYDVLVQPRYVSGVPRDWNEE